MTERLNQLDGDPGGHKALLKRACTSKDPCLREGRNDTRLRTVSHDQRDNQTHERVVLKRLLPGDVTIAHGHEFDDRNDESHDGKSEAKGNDHLPHAREQKSTRVSKALVVRAHSRIVRTVLSRGGRLERWMMATDNIIFHF